VSGTGEILRKAFTYYHTSDSMYRLTYYRFARPVREFEPFKNDKGLMSPIVGIGPAFADYRVEELAQHMIRVERTQILRFKHARTLKFCQAFELVSR
jgi:hypothetical protein